MVESKYTNLQLSTSGSTKTVSAATFGVTGSLTLDSGVTLDLAYVTTGNEWTAANSTLNGTVKYSAAADGAVVINDEYSNLTLTGGTKNIAALGDTVKVANAFVNSTDFTANNVEAGSVDNSNGKMTLAGKLATGALTNANGTITAGGALTASAITNTNGVITLNADGNSWNADQTLAGTVIYNGADQAIVGSKYTNLTLSGSGVKTATGTLTVTDTFTNSVILDAENVALGTVSNAGIMKISGTAAWNSASVGGTVEYDGADQNVAASQYATLILSGSGTKTVSADTFGATMLNQDNGTTLKLAFVTDGTEWTAANSTLEGTVEYAMDNSKVIADDYTNLTLSGSTTAESAFKVAGNLILVAVKNERCLCSL